MPREYEYPFVPGPTAIPSYLFTEAYCKNFASADLEEEFLDDYKDAVCELQKILRTSNDIAIMSGEGMVALWGALKSVLSPDFSVVSINNGLYGAGFGDMAKSLGAKQVTLVPSQCDVRRKLNATQIVEEIRKLKPNLVTMVHCETPTGMLNNCLQEVGAVCKEVNALFLVDFVSSAIGCNVDVDKNNIDLGLLGSQKCLSLKPDLSMVTISQRAWDRINQVNYEGYDALKPFQTALQKKLFPYTHNWHSIYALKLRCEEIRGKQEDIYQQHLKCRDICVERGQQMGLKLFVSDVDACSPTCTAFEVPSDIEWPLLKSELKKKGVSVGGSYGEFAGKVFRIGHMGNQADVTKVSHVMDVLDTIIKTIRTKSN